MINGSFVTDVFESNDVDCALLLSDDYPLNEDAAKDLTRGLPFLQIELADQADFDWMVTDMFASDRFTIPKGVVEIVKWN